MREIKLSHTYGFWERKTRRCSCFVPPILLKFKNCSWILRVVDRVPLFFWRKEQKASTLMPINCSCGLLAEEGRFKWTSQKRTVQPDRLKLWGITLSFTGLNSASGSVGKSFLVLAPFKGLIIILFSLPLRVLGRDFPTGYRVFGSEVGFLGRIIHFRFRFPGKVMENEERNKLTC